MWRIGHAQDHEKGTGCTVLVFPDGAAASCDIRGGAPGTRETALLAPECTVDKINALVLTGGSARGLSAADGVMRYCEERGWGFNSGFGMIPIVPAACLFDLGCGEPSAWPEPSMGMEACLGARPVEESPMGNYGAGTGATVGKYSPLGKAMKSGFGWARKVSGELEVCAVTALNAFGAVRDLAGGFMAGALDGERIIDPGSMSGAGDVWNEWGRNTTLAAIVTNARLDKAACRRVAIMGQAGLAGALFPFNTPFDGDTVFCVATGETSSSTVLVGWLAASALEEAARNAVLHARSAFGFVSFSDLR
ncbi:MAG TPA: P1 family peptidase [Synergistales bacterium]|jgi:L-aminopeptidase/D-esterase-like protein|nr:P1 family peptidase [Synergistales bacterium]